MAELKVVLDQFGKPFCRIKILSKYLGKLNRTSISLGGLQANQRQATPYARWAAAETKRQNIESINEAIVRYPRKLGINTLEKQPLPGNSSKTIRFVREEKLSVATTPTQLVEGISPDAGGITMNQLTLAA